MGPLPGAGVVTLSAGQLSALANLARKQAGDEVEWINIADAQSLTILGFAERSREGWKITPSGAEALHVQNPPPPPGPGTADAVAMVKPLSPPER